MAIITEIETARGRVIVRADGSEIARLPRRHFEKCPLSVGDEIDPERWQDKVAATQFPDAYEAALTHLEYAARSARELSTALKRKGYVAPAIDTVIEKLRESGLIDDARYARRMAEVQSAKPVGVYAFKRRLQAKGISEADAEAALQGFDDDQQRAACLAAAEKLRRKYVGLPPREAKAKLSQALSRRGFGWDAIEAVVDGLTE